MSADPSDRTTEHLLKQIERLTAEAEHAKAGLATLSKERDSWGEHRTKLEAELNLSKSAPVELKAQLDALRGQVRYRDHRDAFSAAAVQAKVRPDAINDLFTLSGYKAEKDEIDPGVFNGILTEAKTARPYLFGEASAKQETTPKPVPAAGRGTGGSATSTGASISRKSMHDPAFMFHHQAEFAKAAKEGRLVD